MLKNRSRRALVTTDTEESAMQTHPTNVTGIFCTGLWIFLLCCLLPSAPTAAAPKGFSLDFTTIRLGDETQGASGANMTPVTVSACLPQKKISLFFRPTFSDYPSRFFAPTLVQ
jgi:hypothetical protein